MKVGLGLWNYPFVALAIEALLSFGGLLLYFRRTSAVDKLGRFGLPVIGVLLLLFQASLVFGPPPPSPAAAAGSALAAYALLAAVAYWLERHRVFSVEHRTSSR